MHKFLNFFIANKDSETPKLKKAVNLTISLLILLGIFIFSLGDYKMRWSSLAPYGNRLLNGYKMTLIITFFSMVISMLLGLIVAFLNNSKILIVHYLSKAYVEIIRGTPFLVQIIFFFYIITPAIGLSNRYFIGVSILAIFSSAYVSEIIRAGIESIGESQHEASRSVGFTTLQKYRYVILPQVITRILPSLTGQLSSLVKDSSLLSVIAVSEFTLNIQEINAINFRTYENYIVLAIGYLLITFPISLISKRLERKYTYES